MSHQKICPFHWKQQYPGFLSILSSLSNQPIQQILSKWQSKVRNGHIKRLTDQQIQLPVFQIAGNNIQHNFISVPANDKVHTIKVKYPILVLLVKNLSKYFKFQITILDSTSTLRTFISSNTQSITRIKPYECSMPLQLQPGWNQIVFNLQEYCQKAFGTSYVQCQKIQINANCRIARVYFNDKEKKQDEIPADYKLFMRVETYKN